MNTTEVYDTYWRFAAERHAMFERRLSDPLGPWTNDRILSAYRFTNVYRVLDRVSQYLVQEIQYGATRSQAPDELFFRTMLFKLFNKIETWEALEQRFGQISWQRFDFDVASTIIEHMRVAGHRIYSAAYIMPSPALGHIRKHENHLALLNRMMIDRLPAKIQNARSLRQVYDLFLSYPGIGPFLAFQYTIDVNYSSMLEFSEADLVVAGPGAVDGISKCFSGSTHASPENIIFDMVDRQDQEFSRLGLDFGGLFGRPLPPIDCQNIFCEISKYARAAHPNAKGISGRTRIKQSYRKSRRPVEAPFLPPRWGISASASINLTGLQGDLFRRSA